jgi:hypothetical protein
VSLVSVFYPNWTHSFFGRKHSFPKNKNKLILDKISKFLSLALVPRTTSLVFIFARHWFFHSSYYGFSVTFFPSDLAFFCSDENKTRQINLDFTRSMKKNKECLTMSKENGHIHVPQMDPPIQMTRLKIRSGPK